MKSIRESFIKHGYHAGTKLAVCEGENGKYVLIDGAHRLAAANELAQHENPTIRQKYEDFSFSCYVFNKLTATQISMLAKGKLYLLI